MVAVELDTDEQVVLKERLFDDFVSVATSATNVVRRQKGLNASVRQFLE